MEKYIEQNTHILLEHGRIHRTKYARPSRKLKNGVEQNQAEALRLYKLAAEQGYTAPQNIGTFL